MAEDEGARRARVQTFTHSIALMRGEADDNRKLADALDSRPAAFPDELRQDYVSALDELIESSQRLRTVVARESRSA